uniref:Uncharacterized protein n=1 Tax=Anguilla anguilla TaxID=7936 RepID=A0A0E9TAN3_ANGAN
MKKIWATWERHNPPPPKDPRVSCLQSSAMFGSVSVFKTRYAFMHLHAVENGLS